MLGIEKVKLKIQKGQLSPEGWVSGAGNILTVPPNISGATWEKGELEFREGVLRIGFPLRLTIR